MDPVLALLVYKVAVLLAGFGVTWFGYRLFVQGILSASGDRDARFAKNRLVLKQAAPGIFYALFGTVVISLAIYRGLDVEAQRPRTTRAERNTALELKMRLSELPNLSVDDRKKYEELLTKMSNAEEGEVRRGLASDGTK